MYLDESNFSGSDFATGFVVCLGVVGVAGCIIGCGFGDEGVTFVSGFPIFACSKSSTRRSSSSGKICWYFSIVYEFSIKYLSVK